MSFACSPPLGVLVIEDEALLAMDIESIVEDAGHCVVAAAGSLREFEALQLNEAPHIAFVDYQLAEGSTGLDVCQGIRARWADTIIVFVTANPGKLPHDLGGAHGVIAKPFSRRGMVSAMRYLEEGVCDPPPISAQPASLLASPALTAKWGDR